MAIITADTIGKEQEKVLRLLSEYNFDVYEVCDCDLTEEEIFFEDNFFEGLNHHYRCNICGRII